MRILYGVQATGQGHISRARAMAAALAHYPVDVDWLFSGRSAEALFDMEPFGQFQHRRGLTFTTRRGRICYLRTVVDNNLPRFISDVVALDTRRYDVVVTDFEPVSAWAARSQGTRSIGIGHQYAFSGNTPRAGAHWLARTIMRNFAPVDLQLGLHWARYNDATLPPILDLPADHGEQGNHVLVYLPFEDQGQVTRLLQGLGAEFVQYAAGLEPAQVGNVLRRPACIRGFKRHLHSCRGVICNSGFELISECLQLGKPILTRPVCGQTEQLSNALALEQLGYGHTLETLDRGTIEQWVPRPPPAPAVHFPDVAAALANWLAAGCRRAPAELSRQLWNSGLAGQTRPGIPLPPRPAPAAA